MGYWQQCRDFYREFRRAYTTTGSILPSGRFLALALVSELRKRRPPRRILEVGPGSGAVTAEILRFLRPGDRLDIVEINENFVALLRRRFAEEPLFRRHADQVQLLHLPLQDVPGVGLYDCMISGLPLNNFPLALIDEIFAAYRRLLKPDGVLSYFEYLCIRQLKLLVTAGAKRQHIYELDQMLTRFVDAHQFREQTVFANVPPAIARHLRFGDIHD